MVTVSLTCMIPSVHFEVENLMTISHQVNEMAGGSGAIVDVGRLDDARKLLTAIASHRSDNFTGVGIVFYVDLSNLPYLQLTNELEDPTATRFDGHDIAEVLLSISTQSSALHDGFHFVDEKSWNLTHLSQFISPPIPYNASQRFHGTGARLMAAALASVLPGICYVGLVSNAGDVHLLRGGIDVFSNN